MVSLHLFMNAEEMGRQFRADARVIEASHDLSMGLLQAGMKSGRPSVSIMFELADGSVVFAETSLDLLAGAVRAFQARMQMLEVPDDKPKN